MRYMVGIFDSARMTTWLETLFHRLTQCSVHTFLNTSYKPEFKPIMRQLWFPRDRRTCPARVLHLHQRKVLFTAEDGMPQLYAKLDTGTMALSLPSAESPEHIIWLPWRYWRHYTIMGPLVRTVQVIAPKQDATSYSFFSLFLLHFLLIYYHLSPSMWANACRQTSLHFILP